MKVDKADEWKVRAVGGLKASSIQCMLSTRIYSNVKLIFFVVIFC